MFGKIVFGNLSIIVNLLLFPYNVMFNLIFGELKKIFLYFCLLPLLLLLFFLVIFVTLSIHSSVYVLQYICMFYVHGMYKMYF